MSISKDNIYATLIMAINRSLLGSVIPGLRGMAFELDESKEEVTLFFYHDGILSEFINNHYDCIASDASGDFFFSNRPIRYNLKIIRIDTPQKLPDHFYWVYRRYEPFEDPKKY